MAEDKSISLVVKESGAVERSTYFDFIKHDLDNYSDIQFTTEEARKIQSHLHKLSTGAYAMVPMYCAGPACPFALRCPLQQINKAPVGRQCHPPGTLIYTSNGYVAIEALVEGKDKIITYASSCGIFYKRGRSFQLGTRQYSDQMLRIAVNNTFYDCTKDHICMATWNKSAKNLFSVYLMKKGDFWRVGKTKLFRETESKQYSGLSSRANTEQCEKIWILGVYETNTEALLAEEYFSILGQIGKACFIDRPCYKKTKKQEGLYKWVTQEQLDNHHRSISKPLCHYAKFLSSLGLDIEYPFWDRNSDYRQIGSIGKIFEIRACNVLSKYMDMITFNESNFQESIGIPELENRGKKETISQIERYHYNGIVYSLDVEKEHNYITNGIVTHNCLIEVQLLNNRIIQYMEEYEVNPNNFTEVSYCNELAEIEIMLMRLNMSLSKPEYASLVIDQAVGVDHEGNPIIQKQISPFMEQKDKLVNRKSKIIKLMVGDRQEKYKKEAALKIKTQGDPSSSMAAMRKQLEGLQRNLNTIEGKLESVPQDTKELEKILTPDSIIESDE